MATTITSRDGRFTATATEHKPGRWIALTSEGTASSISPSEEKCLEKAAELVAKYDATAARVSSMQAPATRRDCRCGGEADTHGICYACGGYQPSEDLGGMVGGLLGIQER